MDLICINADAIVISFHGQICLRKVLSFHCKGAPKIDEYTQDKILIKRKYSVLGGGGNYFQCTEATEHW